MPNVITRLARYLTRSRKRSGSLQNASMNTGNTIQNTTGVTNEEPLHRPSSPKRQNSDEKITDCNDKSAPKSAPPARKNNEHHQTGVENSSKGNKKKPLTDKSNITMITMSKESPQQSNTVRTRRVLRELQVMMRNFSHPDSPFKVSLVDESNLYEWDVSLLKVDENSDLWRSMQQTGTPSIQFRLTFPELFPFQPPFMRLVGPYLDNGFIMEGGAICMEVLTTQGWSSAYTVESLLVQVASGLTQGGAVISRKQKRKNNQLTQKRAEVEFRRICKIHAKYGWVNMERDEV